MNDLDHYIKEKLKVKYYLRYMDDLVILSSDKAKLKEYKEIIKGELEKLHLKMNPKTAIYNCSDGAGMPFLGYRFFVQNGVLKVECLASTVRRIMHRLRVLEKYNHDKFMLSEAAYRGYWQKW